MVADTLPIEVWADMCEDDGQDTLLLRAWLIDQQSHGHDAYWMGIDRLASLGESTHFGISSIFVSGTKKGTYTGGAIKMGHGFMMYTSTGSVGDGFTESGNGGHAYTNLG